MAKVMRSQIAGIELRDWPRAVWTRLTECRREGHLFPFNEYCDNCGAPWFFVGTGK